MLNKEEFIQKHTQDMIDEFGISDSHINIVKLNLGLIHDIADLDNNIISTLFNRLWEHDVNIYKEWIQH